MTPVQKIWKINYRSLEGGPRPPGSKCPWCGKASPIVNGKCSSCGATR